MKLWKFVLLGTMNQARMIRHVIFDVGAALIGGSVVSSASIGFRGPIGKLLKIKPLDPLQIWRGCAESGEPVSIFAEDIGARVQLAAQSTQNLMSIYSWCFAAPLNALEPF